MKKLFCFVLSFLLVMSFSQFTFAVDKELEFAWSHDTPPDLAGFQIHQGSSSGAYDRIINIPLSEVNSNCTPEAGENKFCYKITVPVPDEGVFPYFFAATAYDTEGLYSGYSEEVDTTYDFAKPPAIADLSAVADVENKVITFNWNYLTDWLSKIEKFSLWQSDTKGGPYTTVVDIPYDPNSTPPYTTDISIEVPSGSKVTRYYVLVVHRGAENNYRFSEDSNEVEITIDLMPPKSPFEFKIKIKN